MHQAVKRGKILESLLVEDRRQVELDVSLPPDERAVAQQPERQAVGDDAPEILGAIEVLLNQRMGRQAGPPRGRHSPQFLPRSHDVHGRRIVRLAGAVRDGKESPSTSWAFGLDRSS